VVYKLVVTQFWIHQDFLKCYFISIIIYKNPKKLRKRKIQKYIFLESTASFRQNRVHQVNTGQTMSTRVKMSFGPFRVKTVIFYRNRVHRVNTVQTMSTRVKNEFRAVSGQNRHFWPKPSSPGQTMSTRIKNEFHAVVGRTCYLLVKTRSTGFISIESFFYMFQHNFR